MTLVTEFLMDRRTAQSVAAKDCRSTTSRKQLKLDKLTGSSKTLLYIHLTEESDYRSHS